MVIWGSLPVFVSGIHSLSSVEIALSRVIIAMAIMLIAKAIKRDKIEKNLIKKNLPVLLLSGACMGLNWVFLFESYRFVDSGISTLLYYLSPIIFMTATVIFLKEKISGIQIAAIVIALFGMVVTTVSASGGSNVPKGVAFGLLSATFYASVMFFNKWVKDIDGITKTLFQLIGAFIALCPYALIVHEGGFPQLTAKEILYIFILGTFHSGVALLLYFSAMPYIKSQSIAVLSYIDPVSSIFFVTLILNEKLTLPKALGAILIIGGAIIGEIFGKKKRDV